MKRAMFWLLLLALAGAGGWWVMTEHKGDASAALADARYRATALAGRFGIGPDARPAQAARPAGPMRVNVVSAEATSVDLPLTRAAVGWIEPTAAVQVRARADGQIVEQLVQDGQTVTQGQLLFRLDDREVRAQLARDEATLMKDQATQAKSQADVRRVGELLSKNAASQLQFDVVTADSKVAAANVAADQAALEATRVRLDYTSIRAPLAGRVGTVRITAGNLVKGNESSGDGLATITQMKPLRASFALPERDLDLLRAALAGNEGTVRAYPGSGDQLLAKGRLSFVDSAVDQASGTVTTRALFDNEDGRLWPGQYVRIEIDLANRLNVVTVPLVAVQPGQDGSFAFVIKADRTIERRRVEMLEARGAVAALASGLKAGERVVIEGGLRVRQGTPVNEKIAAPAADAQVAVPAAAGRTAQAEAPGEAGVVRR